MEDRSFVLGVSGHSILPCQSTGLGRSCRLDLDPLDRSRGRSLSGLGCCLFPRSVDERSRGFHDLPNGTGSFGSRRCLSLKENESTKSQI